MTSRTVRSAHRTLGRYGRYGRHGGHGLRAWAAVVATAVIGTACSGPDMALPAPPPIRPDIQAPAFRAVTVTDADSGVPVTLANAQEFVVRLQTDVLNGLEWSLVELQPTGVLALTEHRFERAPRGVAVEAEGDSVWHFKPVASGSVGMRFELRRPHSLEPASRVVTYVVTVRAATAATAGSGTASLPSASGLR